MIRSVRNAGRVGGLILCSFPVWAGQAHIGNEQAANQFEELLLKDPRSLPALTGVSEDPEA